MNNKNRKGVNWPVILPVGLLLVEIVAVVVLLIVGYEITEFLLYFFIFFGLFLLYQLARHLLNVWRVRSAVRRLKKIDALADSGQPMAAIKEWKKVLLRLPREEYLETLFRMKAVYEEQCMEKAVQQIQAIISESKNFFEMSRDLRQMTREDRRNFQSKAYELRNMINALPVRKGQNLSDV